MNERTKVLVAVDESEGALHALDWACHYASMAGCEVDALHVWGYPEPGLRTAISEPYEDMHLEAMEVVRDQVRRYIDDHHPLMPIHARAVEGPVVETLVDESHHASILVVGRRGHSALANLMGSVSRNVAERAACPVVVVHPRDRV